MSRKIKLPEVNSPRWKNPKSITKEVWVDAISFKCVRVSNYGRVKERGRGVLYETIDGRSYYKVDIGGKHVSVARLVCGAFHKNPENKRCVDHINGNRLDNRADNLRWATHSENSRNPNTRFIQKGTKRIEQYYKGRLVATYGSIRYASEITGFPRSTLGKRLAAEGGKILMRGYLFVESKNPANGPANEKEETRRRVLYNGFPKPLNNLEP